MGNPSRQFPAAPSSGVVEEQTHFFLRNNVPSSPTKVPAYFDLYAQKQPAIPGTGQRDSQFMHTTRRHSVTVSAGSPVLIGNKFHNNNTWDAVFLDDDTDTSSNSTGSPQIHRKIGRSRSDPIAPVGLQPNAVGSILPTIQPSRYKTEMCKSFVENGKCRYAEKCQFAHGFEELRIINRHPKYRTEKCRSFHTTGFCMYAQRCHFIHNEEPGYASFATDYQQNVPLTAPAANGNASIMSLQSAPGSKFVQGSAMQAGSGRPRAVSLSAFSHPIPIGHNFMADQRLELGSCADSHTTSLSSGSFPSSPLSLSPGVDSHCHGWFTAHQEFPRGSLCGIDGLGSVTEESGDLPGPWATALSCITILDLEE